MARKLKDKVVVITGASSGIGRATALAFARKGAHVVCAARRRTPLESLVEECREFGVHAMAVPTDVTDYEAVKTLARRTIERFGRIDVWFNNAGVTLFARLDEAPMEVYHEVLETNFFGYVHGARAVLPYFREQGYGMIINNGSMLSKGGAPFLSAYVASKFAIYGWSESLRQELLDTNIEVCTVMPASIDTPIFQNAANYTGRAIKPMDPIYPAEKVADAVVRLVTHPEKEVYVGHAGRMMGALHKVAPSRYEKTQARKVDQDHFRDDPAPPSSGTVLSPSNRWTGVSGGWRNGGFFQKKSVRALALAGVAIALPAAASWWLNQQNEDQLIDRFSSVLKGLT
jgi:short-subunit dehydrogenase